ncbi:hypothetical protein FDP41_011699 [Naegleria fowleri]|uniref:Uncharacterized protein n=1 Tax=Naegleria fowleri TaxID=5763 RepID=A0A6A5C7V5_NAEFO|nr:uncharacterized protein FDP41_011699 [Naegleria fowleri]KAF0981838.1 hypothetical protein FDP41_011699 [Naegleria fowleri]
MMNCFLPLQNRTIQQKEGFSLIQYYFNINNASLMETHSYYDRSSGYISLPPTVDFPYVVWNDFCLSNHSEKDAFECWNRTVVDHIKLVQGFPSFSVFLNHKTHFQELKKNYWRKNENNEMKAVVMNQDLRVLLKEDVQKKVNFGRKLSFIVVTILALFATIAYCLFYIVRISGSTTHVFSCCCGFKASRTNCEDFEMWKTFDPSFRISINESFQSKKKDESFFSFEEKNRSLVIKCSLPSHELGPHLTDVFLSNPVDKEKLILYERAVNSFVNAGRGPFKVRFLLPVALLLIISFSSSIIIFTLALTLLKTMLFTIIGLFGLVMVFSILYFLYKFECSGMHYFVTNHRLVIVESMSDCYNIYYIMLQDIERVWMNEDDKLMAEIHDEKHGFVKGVLLERVSDHQFYLNALSN